MGDTKVGKKFENDIKDALKEIQRKTRLFFYRFTDSYAARKLVGNTPADFLVAYTTVQLWEAKSSEKYASLKSCLAAMVDDDQVSYHRLWSNNGHESFFLFYSDLTGLVEVWQGEAVVEARLSGKPLHNPAMMRFPIMNLTAELRALLEQ